MVPAYSPFVKVGNVPAAVEEFEAALFEAIDRVDLARACLNTAATLLEDHAAAICEHIDDDAESYDYEIGGAQWSLHTVQEVLEALLGDRALERIRAGKRAEALEMIAGADEPVIRTATDMENRPVAG